MQGERQICCCGASSWTKVIAWFQIIGCGIIFTFCLIDLVNHNDLRINKMSRTYEEATTNNDVAKTSFALVIIGSVPGIIMGIILLIGTNNKRVGYLKAWMIYCTLTVVIHIVNIILRIVYNKAVENVNSLVLSGVLGVTFNAFCLTVVYIHIKEINEGVFRQGYVYNVGPVYANQ